MHVAPPLIWTPQVTHKWLFCYLVRNPVQNQQKCNPKVAWVVGIKLQHVSSSRNIFGTTSMTLRAMKYHLNHLNRNFGLEIYFHAFVDETPMQRSDCSIVCAHTTGYGSQKRKSFPAFSASSGCSPTMERRLFACLEGLHHLFTDESCFHLWTFSSGGMKWQDAFLSRHRCLAISGWDLQWPDTGGHWCLFYFYAEVRWPLWAILGWLKELLPSLDFRSCLKWPITLWKCHLEHCRVSGYSGWTWNFHSERHFKGGLATASDPEMTRHTCLLFRGVWAFHHRIRKPRSLYAHKQHTPAQNRSDSDRAKVWYALVYGSKRAWRTRGGQRQVNVSHWRIFSTKRIWKISLPEVLNLRRQQNRCIWQRSFQHENKSLITKLAETSKWAFPDQNVAANNDMFLGRTQNIVVKNTVNFACFGAFSDAFSIENRNFHSKYFVVWRGHLRMFWRCT